jgi:hypothetical protein
VPSSGCQGRVVMGLHPPKAMKTTYVVTPAKLVLRESGGAWVQGQRGTRWIPACSGMT